LDRPLHRAAIRCTRPRIGPAEAGRTALLQSCGKRLRLARSKPSGGVLPWLARAVVPTVVPADETGADGGGYISECRPKRPVDCDWTLVTAGGPVERSEFPSPLKYVEKEQ